MKRLSSIAQKLCNEFCLVHRDYQEGSCSYESIESSNLVEFINSLLWDLKEELLNETNRLRRNLPGLGYDDESVANTLTHVDGLIHAIYDNNESK